MKRQSEERGRFGENNKKYMEGSHQIDEPFSELVNTPAKMMLSVKSGQEDHGWLTRLRLFPT